LKSTTIHPIENDKYVRINFFFNIHSEVMRY